MAFLTDDDYKAQIKDDILARLLENSATMREDAERKAIAQAQSRLANRYDVPAIFSLSGQARNAELVMYLVDMSLYHLHSRLTPGQVPEVRNSRYADALEWLKAVSSGDWNPGFPLVGDSDGDGIDDKNVVQGGSSTPRNPYF